MAPAAHLSAPEAVNPQITAILAPSQPVAAQDMPRITRIR